MSIAEIPTPQPAKTAFWNDPVKRSIILQCALGAFVLFVCWSAYSNMMANMKARGLVFGWDYLSRSANFAIGEALIPFSAQDTYGRALVVGILNTVKIAIVGIFLTTLLGISLGVMRLSTNPLLSRLDRKSVV